MSEDNELTKIEKLKKLGIPEDKYDYFSKITTDIMYDNMLENLKKQTNENYMLHFLNMILRELNRDPIDRIENFIIKRDEYKKLDGVKFAEKNLKMIESYGVTKKDMHYGMRNTLKSFELMVLKKVAKALGYKLISKYRNKKNGKRYTIYVITKI